jgi:hypothetical protein
MCGALWARSSPSRRSAAPCRGCSIGRCALPPRGCPHYCRRPSHSGALAATPPNHDFGSRAAAPPIPMLSPQLFAIASQRNSAESAQDVAHGNPDGRAAPIALHRPRRNIALHFHTATSVTVVFPPPRRNTSRHGVILRLLQPGHDAALSYCCKPEPSTRGNRSHDKGRTTGRCRTWRRPTSCRPSTRTSPARSRCAALGGATRGSRPHAPARISHRTLLSSCCAAAQLDPLSDPLSDPRLGPPSSTSRGSAKCTASHCPICHPPGKFPNPPRDKLLPEPLSRRAAGSARSSRRPSAPSTSRADPASRARASHSHPASRARRAPELRRSRAPSSAGAERPESSSAGAGRPGPGQPASRVRRAPTGPAPQDPALSQAP